MIVKAAAGAASSSNKPLIKKLVGLIVVAAVCVTVIVVVVKVLGSFGSSDDDNKQKAKFDGKSNEFKKTNEQTSKEIHLKMAVTFSCITFSLQSSSRLCSPCTDKQWRSRSFRSFVTQIWRFP